MTPRMNQGADFPNETLGLAAGVVGGGCQVVQYIAAARQKEMNVSMAVVATINAWYGYKGMGFRLWPRGVDDMRRKENTKNSLWHLYAASVYKKCTKAANFIQRDIGHRLRILRIGG